MSRISGQAANGKTILPTKPGTNIGGAGEHNRRVVMQGLRVNGTMSRAQIARGTGLVPQTVSNIIEDLEREGLVIAASPVKAGRGQPATPYSIAPDGAFAFGMQIDQHSARVVVVNLLGQIVAGTEASLGPGGLEANLGRVLSAFAQVSARLERHAGSSPRILGLGLAMPAPTGVHRQDDPWMVGLTGDHPMVKALERSTGLTVSLHHDASAAAVAERLTGAAKGLDNFVLIFVGYGLGAGIYTGGELYRGHHRMAGELGLVPVPLTDGVRALEDLTSLSALYAMLDLRPSQPDLADRLRRADETQAPELARWLAEAAAHLVWAIDLIECLVRTRNAWSSPARCPTGSPRG